MRERRKRRGETEDKWSLVRKEEENREQRKETKREKNFIVKNEPCDEK